MLEHIYEIHYILRAEISGDIEEYLTERINGGVTHFKIDPQNTIFSLKEI